MSYKLRKKPGWPYWLARITPPGGKRFERSTKCAKKADAHIVAARWDREASLQSHTVTLVEAFEHYHAKLKRKGARPGTIERFELSVAHLLGFLGEDRDIDTIRLHDTTAYVDHRRRGRTAQDKRGFKRTMPPASNRTIAIELGHLQAALQRCLELELYRRSPKALWPPELGKAARRRKRWLTTAEYLQLVAALAPAEGYLRGGKLCRYREPERAARDWRDHLAVLCHTGMRAGELYVPTGADLQGDQLFVAGYKTAHATDRAERFVPVHPDIAEVLRRRAREAGQHGRLFPIDSETKGSDHDRLRAQERALLRALQKACDRIGIPRCNENDLRRTFASWHRHAGTPEADVVEWMGHTSSRMVREVYAQSSADHARQQMARLPSRRKAKQA